MKRWLGLALFLGAGFYATGALTVGGGKAVLTIEPLVVSVEAHLPNIGWLPSIFPGTAPIKPEQPGLHVAIIEETSERSKLTPAQLNILTGTKLRQWVAANCAKGPDGKTPQFRILDKDTDMSHESKTWQDAVKAERKALPWLLVANGSKGTAAPLPADEDSLITLLEGYK